MKLTKIEIYKRLCYKYKLDELLEECNKQGFLKSTNRLVGEGYHIIENCKNRINISRQKYYYKNNSNKPEDAVKPKDMDGYKKITKEIILSLNISSYDKLLMLLNSLSRLNPKEQQIITDTISTICRYCKKEIKMEEFDAVVNYGSNGDLSPVHKQCKKICIEKEAYGYQSMDSDCNDCKFFERFFPKKEIVLSENEKINNGSSQHMCGIGGMCTKHNKRVCANPGLFTGMECFVHRKGKNYYDKKAK